MLHALLSHAYKIFNIILKICNIYHHPHHLHCYNSLHYTNPLIANISPLNLAVQIPHMIAALHLSAKSNRLNNLLP